MGDRDPIVARAEKAMRASNRRIDALKEVAGKIASDSHNPGGSAAEQSQDDLTLIRLDLRIIRRLLEKLVDIAAIRAIQSDGQD